MVSDRLQQRIGQETVDGWRLVAIDGDRAVLKKPNYGSVLGHVLVAVVTVWFTAGIGNLAYAVYRYLNNTNYRIVSVEEPIDDEEALATLRRRYARGEIDDDEFERRLDWLRETETLEDVRAQVANERITERS